MKRFAISALAFSLLAAISSFSQTSNQAQPVTRGRVVVTDTMPPIKPPSHPVPAPSATPIIVGGKYDKADTDGEASTPAEVSSNNPLPARALQTRAVSFGFIKSKIAEAKHLLQQRPLATAMSAPSATPETGSFAAPASAYTPADVVRIAFHDWKTGRIDFVVLTKDAFLSTASDKAALSENGRQINIRTIRGNGVNTPITLTDERGDNELPLLIQYPVIRNGRYIETAYYMSTHPGLVTPEVVNAGQYYVRNIIELAREHLREKGIVIQPKVADIAERLAAVEHVDHMRFRTESARDIFNDIYTLFALNEGQTFRYSVSSAGAGGMVQMIPSTYRMVRSWHPNVPLNADFVEGMRNHVNASEAMLLYMQRTWDDLIASPTVSTAFSTGIATQEQLMAAGYNSNPAKIAGYINRGGQNWTSLIPNETKMYLQIFDSIEKFVPMNARTR